jgi:uncharacterized protein YdaL
LTDHFDKKVKRIKYNNKKTAKNTLLQLKRKARTVIRNLTLSMVRVMGQTRNNNNRAKPYHGNNIKAISTTQARVNLIAMALTIWKIHQNQYHFQATNYQTLNQRIHKEPSIIRLKNKRKR